MVARVLLLLPAGVLLFIAAALFRSPSGPRDALGVSGPTVVRAAREEGGPVEPLLAYTGSSRRRGAWLLARPADEASNGATTEALLALQPRAEVHLNGIYGAQFVAPDRIYYVRRSSSGDTLPERSVCMARWSGGVWQPLSEPILRAARGGIDWVSVLPPGAAGTEWRMWFVEASGDQSELGYATSYDGILWDRKPQSSWRPDTGRVQTISVLPWGHGLRAWAVIYDPAATARSLVGFDIAPDGKPASDPEPVAWQAPELRFGNLPKEAIPIIDARAESGADSREVRLYITYRGTDGKSRITTAENFPVAGARSPSIFARQVKPLIEQGSDRAPGHNSPFIAPVLILVALILVLFALRPGGRPTAKPGAQDELLQAPADDGRPAPNGRHT